MPLNYGGNPLAMLGQAPQAQGQQAPPLDLSQLGLGSVPEWQALISDPATDPRKQPYPNYAGQEIRPSPDNGTGIYVADPNEQMGQSVWNYLYGRQIGRPGNL